MRRSYKPKGSVQFTRWVPNFECTGRDGDSKDSNRPAGKPKLSSLAHSDCIQIDLRACHLMDKVLVYETSNRGSNPRRPSKFDGDVNQQECSTLRKRVSSVKPPTAIIRPCRSMDRTSVFETDYLGSSPSGASILLGAVSSELLLGRTTRKGCRRFKTVDL